MENFRNKSWNTEWLIVLKWPTILITYICPSTLAHPILLGQILKSGLLTTASGLHTEDPNSLQPRSHIRSKAQEPGAAASFLPNSSLGLFLQFYSLIFDFSQAIFITFKTKDVPGRNRYNVYVYVCMYIVLSFHLSRFVRASFSNNCFCHLYLEKKFKLHRLSKNMSSLLPTKEGKIQTKQKHEWLQ